ncbi:type II secretion system protein N [Shewanella sp. YIC-542]|uniref:type II secretion system protein N n=1 Tax=Shewanella mytili TaxID=3377111 RepID=UPI00398F6FF1
MKLFGKIVIGILLYLLFMIMLFPARVAVALMPLPSGVQLGGVSGSLWHGQADVLQIGSRQLERLSWQLQPSSLFTGVVQAQWQLGSRASAVNGKGIISWSSAGIAARQLRLDAPVGFLVGNRRLPFKTVLSGDISLLLDEGHQGQPLCGGLNGKLFLNHIGLNNQFGDYPLGNMAFSLQCVKGQVQLATDDEKNAIGVAGTLLFKDQLQMEVNGRIRRTDGQSRDLQNSLGLLGKPDANGNYPLQYKGRIPGL